MTIYAIIKIYAQSKDYSLPSGLITLLYLFALYSIDYMLFT